MSVDFSFTFGRKGAEGALMIRFLFMKLFVPLHPVGQVGPEFTLGAAEFGDMMPIIIQDFIV